MTERTIFNKAWEQGALAGLDTPWMRCPFPSLPGSLLVKAWRNGFDLGRQCGERGLAGLIEVFGNERHGIGQELRGFSGLDSKRQMKQRLS